MLTTPSDLPDPGKKAAYLEGVRAGPDAVARRIRAVWSANGEQIHVGASQVDSLRAWFDHHGYALRERSAAFDRSVTMTYVYAPTEELSAWLMLDSDGSARMVRWSDGSGPAGYPVGESPFARLAEHLGLSIQEAERLAQQLRLHKEAERRAKEAAYLEALRQGPDELAQRIDATFTKEGWIRVGEASVADLSRWFEAHGYSVRSERRRTTGATLSDGTHHADFMTSETHVVLPDGSSTVSYLQLGREGVLLRANAGPGISRLAEHLGVRKYVPPQPRAADVPGTVDLSENVAAARASTRSCGVCGAPLSVLDRLLRRRRHPRC